MIIGIGTDICNIGRIAAMLDRHGDRFAKKILSDVEYAKFLSSYNKKAFLAKRFAAKEAASKAFGTGFRDGLFLSHIEVKNDDQGKPSLVFHEKASELIAKMGVTHTHLSISDEKDVAVAFVVFEKS